MAGKVIRKVFSPTLARSYYICLDKNPPIDKCPCFTKRECDWIQKQKLKSDELEYLFNLRVDDWMAPVIPNEELVKIEPPQDTRPETVKQAQADFFKWVKENFRGAKSEKQ